MVSVPWGTASYREGTVNVVPANAQFGVSLEAVPTKLYGGGTVYFTVKVFNYVNSAYSIRGYVVGEDGNKVYPKDEEYFEARLPANGNYTAYFDLPVSGIGNHTYMLYVDNYGGESHTDSVKIEVKQGNGELQQIAFECDDLYISTGIDREHHLLYKGTLTCRAILYNPSNMEIEGDVEVISPVKVTPVALSNNLVGEWSYTSYISVPPQGYSTVEFWRNTGEINVYDLETELYGAIFTVELHYRINGKEFIGIGSGTITQNSVQAAISSTVFIGGCVAATVGLVVSSPVLQTIGVISFVVGLYQTVG